MQTAEQQTAPADLPTVGGEAALFYTLTAADVAEALGGFRASEVGVLLGARGLRWAGNSDYQELARHKKTTLTRFWHKDIVLKIRLILDENMPNKHGISDKLALAVFRKWKKRQAENDLLSSIVTTGSSH